jgi:asparagine synthase (glutamine-hydrolysing)
MCGICGYLNLNNEKVEGPEIVKTMAQALTKRGPDTEGFYQEGPFTMGMRRLSIIDLKTGDQPIHNEDETIWVILNGEIYNYRILRNKLKEKGHRFYTDSDTEVLVHLYEDKGEHCVDELEGMFSFCIYERNEKKLFFARDRFGEKPFFYYLDDRIFVFASEIKGILKHPDLNKDLDSLSLNKYLIYGYVPGPNSIFKNIKKLKGAHTLTVTFKNEVELAITPFWTQSFQNKIPSREPDILKGISNKLRSSVESRLISDVPLGVLLSGGIDSSLIVLMASELLAPKKLKTFTIGFKEKEFDESGYAEIVANHCHTEHNRKIVSVRDALNVLPEIFDYMDEPMSDPSIIPTYLLCRFVRQHVKVALSGDGGDELFAGYPKYIITRLLELEELLPQQLQSVGNMLLKGFFRKNTARVSKFMETLEYPLAMRNQLWISAFLPSQIPQLLNKEFAFRDESGLLDDLVSQLALFNGSGALDRSFFLDTVLNLQDLYLVKTDRASMMNSLELRAPFLDLELVKYSCNIDANLKIKFFRNKYLLKKIAALHLPRQVVYRKKMGFGIPLAQWLRQDLSENTKDLKNNPLLNPIYIDTLLKEHVSYAKDHSGKIWSLVVFNEWFKRWLN